MINFSCPHCEKIIKVQDEAAGRKGKCNQCGEAIRVPKRSTEVEQASPPARYQHEPMIVADPPVTPAPIIVPVSAVQVTVNQSNVSHSLGIASLIMGILAFFVCWMPFIGASFAGLGLVLGMGGLYVALTRKGAGIGFSIAGTAVSGLALLIGGIWTLMISSAVTGTAIAIDEAVEAVNVAENDAGKAGKPVVGQGNGGQNVQQPKGPVWHRANLPQELGDVRVTIKRVVVGKVPLRNEIFDTDSESKDRLLTVWVEIRNTSERKKMDYSGWMSRFASLRDIDASLTDDVENRYRGIQFSSSVTVKDAKTEESIYPGKSITDAIVFELPVENVKFLRLKLSGNAFGDEGELRFEIPNSMIQGGPRTAEQSTVPELDSRKVWVNLTYKTTIRQSTGKAWQEVDDETGRVNWEDEEVIRTSEFVELFCPKRKIGIRLFAQRMESKEDGNWKRVASGHWKTSSSGR